MTTVTCNREQIAADRQATHSGGLKFKLKTKLFTFDTPTLYKTKFHVGLAGSVDAFPNVISFFSDPTDFKTAPKMKGGEGIILTEDGKIFTFFSCANWILVDQPYYSIGSGSHIAMGAMAAGKTPAEAVKLAIKHDPSTGLGVTKIDIKAN